MRVRLIPPLVAAAFTSAAAMADTAYVKPSTFAPVLDQTLSVEASFSDDCCEPRYPVRSDTFQLIHPDGTRAAIEGVEHFANATVFDVTVAAPGTTRITTGERLGRKGEYVQIDGTYHLINSPDAEPIDIPDGTPILSSQTATVTDAYVTVGLQDWGAIRISVGRLAMTPMQHPNTVKVGDVFSGQVTLDGAPVAGTTVALTTEYQRLLDADALTVDTDADGQFSVTFADPGAHVLMVRLQAPAPAGAETDIRSYTTALTLDVSPE